jgi:hypothetical protein
VLNPPWTNVADEDGVIAETSDADKLLHLLGTASCGDFVQCAEKHWGKFALAPKYAFQVWEPSDQVQIQAVGMRPFQ